MGPGAPVLGHAELQRLYIFQKKATSVQVYPCLLLLLRGVMFQTFKLMSAPAPAGLAREGGAMASYPSLALHVSPLKLNSNGRL